MHGASHPLERDDRQRSRRRAWAAAHTAMLAAALTVASCGGDDTVVAGAAVDAGVAVDGGADGTVGDAPAGATDAAVVDDADQGSDAAAADTAAEAGGDAVDDRGAATDASGDDVLSDVPGACQANQCTIDGACVDGGAVKPDEPCRRCVLVLSATAWSLVTGGCSDGDHCTEGDTCDPQGNCAGTPKLCDDGNTCSDDACKDGVCQVTWNSQPCADGDVCTLSDACADGACKAGAAKTCDDGNVCTNDGCDAKKGCTASANNATCDDGDACTGPATAPDTCANGGCQGGGKVACDDQNVCTIDACAPATGCKHTSIADKCQDDNPCTEAGCDKVKGCVFPPIQAVCSDQSLCTEQDLCVDGQCKGTAVKVDDDNPCTNDSCDPKLGVAHVANTLPCDDDNACTLGDTCAASKCQPGPSKPDCDDGNACTADACDTTQGCQNVATTKACDDGDACTAKDTCKDAACKGSAVSCDDGNACTTDACDAKTGCSNKVVISNACRPQIDITYPPRGATIKSELPFVTVKGKVTSGAGAITSFLLNSKTVKLNKDGTFAHEVVAAIGGNTLSFEAIDALGTKRKRVQAFLWSDSYLLPDITKPKSGMVDPGVGYFLSKQAIDDGNHSLPPNDLATIFELFLQNYDIASVIPNPAYQGNGMTATISDLTYDKAKVTLTPEPGTLVLKATIPNLKSKIQVKYIVTLNGNLTIKNIHLTAKIKPKVVNHALVTDVSDVQVTLEGFDIKLTGLGSLLNFLVDMLEATFVKELEKSFADALAKELGPVIADALGALAFAFDIEVAKLDGSGDKVKANLLTDFSEVIIDTTGAIFRLRAGVYAAKGNTVDNLGVPKRIGCGKGVQPLVIPKKSPLELSLADDTLNEFLFALWRGGLLEFPVGDKLLGGVDLSQYGISKLKMQTKALLAPTATDCNDEGELLAHIGDFRVDATLDLFGQPMTVVVHATFVAGIEVSVAANMLTIKLTSIKSVFTDVEVKEESLIASESVIETLVADTLVKNILDLLGGSALGGFELPTIDLSGTVKGLPPGTGIAIDPKVVLRSEGNTIVGGNLK